MTDCGCIYFNSLEHEDQDKYSKKLNLCKTSCPYCSEIWDSSVTCWPALTYFDIINYLIFERNAYTFEEFNAFRSLKSYQTFAEGRVKEIYCHVTDEENKNCVLKASVQASQKKDKWLNPWVCISREGKIIGAHCTCMAGVAGVCSHVAGVLFKINYANLAGYLDEAVTSKACAWNQYHKEDVEPEIAENLVYNSSVHPSTKKKRKSSEVSASTQSKVKALSGAALEEKIRDLMEIAPDAVYFGGTEYSTTDTGSEVGEDLTLPPIMLNHFIDLDDIDNEDYIVETSANLLSNLTATKHQCLKLFNLTKEQSHCKLWSEYRQGRVTGSTCHTIFRLRSTTDRNGILKELIWSDPNSKANIPAIKWGRNNEDTARNHYEIKMKQLHKGFRVDKAGFMISYKYPYTGATPDGIRTCSCHGRGTLEIKCTYKYREKDIHSSTDTFHQDSSFCLDKWGNLKKSHSYYSQVQLQMYVMGVTFSDFVVWSTKGLRVVSIPRNDAYCTKLMESIKNFAEEYLSIELVTRSLK